jgi:tetratricopeptide (TPR) repeat protein
MRAASRSRGKICARSLLSSAILFALCDATPVLAQGRCAQPIARVVEAEGIVAIGPTSGLIAIAAGSQADICQGDTVQAGARSRAAVLLLGSNQIVRINQNTTLTILPEMPQGQRTVIELLRGLIRLINPIGRGLDVRTPYVTAGTEGTEFFVAYEPDTQDTTAGVIEGIVRVSTAAESLRVEPGQVVRARQAGPLQRLNVRPNDAVRWAIFYPPVTWTLSPAEEMALDPRVRTAWDAWRMGNLSAFAQALNAIPLPPPNAPQAAALNAPSLLRFASLLLVVGQVDEAEVAINRAETLFTRASLAPALRPAAVETGGCRSLGPDWTLIPSLRAIIAVARNETADALAQSDCALSAARAANDASATIAAAIARSYALQSAFRLPEARDVLAGVAAQNDPLVFARLAELDLSLGDTGGARREAQQAAEIAPSLSLTTSILGFSALANFEFSTSRDAFARAATLDPADPLPHLGLGLVAIRRGDLEEGRRELVIAVGLDPENALARSYLGRAYAALRMYDDAFREWSLAEMADPKDPTAPLYRAFAERSLNRPIEALSDIDKSIRLNGNRAVYRSRLLLDQDLATRTTDLASTYRDLGFDELALSEAYKSVTDAPTDPGAHRFLSDTYLTQSRHETASDSELLQSLLLQPLNVQPLRPRLAREGLGILDLQGPPRVGYNEFNPLFASNGLNLLADAFGGNRGTYGDNFVVSGIYDNFSLSAGQFYYRTEGIRPNNELRLGIEDVIVQVALSDRISLLGEFRHSATDTGDSQLLFDPANFSPTALESADRTQYRLAGRFEVEPDITLVAVWTRENLSQVDDTGQDFSVNGKVNGDFGEAAIYLSRAQFSAIAGGGYLSSPEALSYTIDAVTYPQAETTTTHGNAWVYANGEFNDGLRITLGASFDQYRSGDIQRDQLNPKFGLSWEIAPGSFLRAAYFHTLNRTLVGGQTIEPTSVAGFNQLFDDIAATRARRWGVGLDQRISDRLFAGIEWSQRELVVPRQFVEGPVPFEDQDWREDFVRTYLDWMATDNLTVNFGAQWQRLVRNPFGISPGLFSNLDLIKLPLEFRYFHPSGALAFLRTSFVHESGNFLDSAFVLSKGSDTFTVVDAGIGWRIPGRQLVGTLQIKNLLNSGFRFQDVDPSNPAFIPHRLVVGRITFSF